MHRGEIRMWASSAQRECRICGAGSTRALIDIYGAAVCDTCLRRIDADPREKRQIMFGLSDTAYW